jgi:gliding motility-associated-like protein
MKLTFTYLNGYSKFFTLLLFVFSITLVSQLSYGQTKIYATEATVKSDEVENKNNAVGNTGNFAIVKSNTGLSVLGVTLGAYNGELELKFPSTVPANRTTFIRIDFEPDLLNALLGGNLGSVLANTLGGLVLGKHSIEVGARNGAVNGTSGSSTGGFSTNNVKLVKDAAGLYYVAITPTAAYDRVYIRDVSSALLLGLGASNSTKVYGAFHVASLSDCEPAFATDFDGSGLTVSALNIGKAGVTDMHQAIDNNPSTASKLSLGLLGVAGSISQNVYFSSATSNGDDVNVKLSVSKTLVDAGVLNRLSIAVYNGGNLVTSFSDFSLLNLELLTLLRSGDPVNVRIPTSAPFDRVSITLTSLLNASLDQTVNVFEVTRSAPKPTFTAPNSNAVSTCLNSTATLSATTASTNQLLWYDAAVGGTLLATKAYNETFVTPALTANKTFYVAAKRIGCAEESERVAVNVTVIPALTAPVVASANLNSCSGAPVTISVTNPDATITYRWYDVATAGTVLFTGPTFVTPALTANKTYYVEASKTGCVSATRTVVNVTFTASPVLPQIQASASSIPAGQSVTLTATSTDTNVEFLWYTSANSTTAIYTGATFVTPTLNATTTYYVEAKSKTNQCVSPSRVSVTVNVDNGGSAIPVPCNAATGETHGVDGVALLADVVNPGLAIDNNTQTASTLLMPIGALNASVYQRLSFDNLSNVGDTVRVLISSPGQLLSLSLLGSVQLTTYNGTVSNGDAISLNNALINLELLSGSTQALLTFVPTKIFNTVEIRLNSGLLGALTSLGVNYAQQVTAAPEVTSAQVTVCSNQTTTLSVKNPKANLTYKWYDAAGVYQTGKDGVSFVTPAITANTKYFVAASTSTGCISYKTVINLTVAPSATATDIQVDGSTTVCGSTSATLTASSTTVTNPIFTWYSNANLTTVVYTGAVFVTPVLNSTTTYYVTVKGTNRCENSPANAKSVTLTISSVPVMPIVATAGTTICTGSATTLNIQNVQTGVTYQWFVDATTTTVLATGVSFTTGVLNANTDYYVRAVGTTGCTGASERTKVTVTVTAKPGNATVASTTINSCTGSTATITISNPLSGVTYTYYSAATGGTALGTGNSFTTPVLTSNTTYYVAASAGNCSSDSRTQVNVVVSAIPTAPTSVTASSNQSCVGSTVILTVNNPDANLNYRWYSVANAGTALFEGNSYTTQALTATTTFYVESVSKIGGCASTTRTAVTVTVNPVLATPVVTVQTVTNSSILFAWNAVAGATGYEISINGGTNWVPVANTTYLASGLQAAQSVTILVRAKGQVACQTSANSTPTTGTTDGPSNTDLYVPNTFTPNGDGRNDIFLAYGKSVANFKMRIYNQWGQLISETSNISQGWDGSFKGTIQPSGVYVYQIEVKFNGDTTAKTYKGTVTLLR